MQTVLTNRHILLEFFCLGDRDGGGGNSPKIRGGGGGVKTLNVQGPLKLTPVLQRFYSKLPIWASRGPTLRGATRGGRATPPSSVQYTPSIRLNLIATRSSQSRNWGHRPAAESPATRPRLNRREKVDETWVQHLSMTGSTLPLGNAIFQARKKNRPP